MKDYKNQGIGIILKTVYMPPLSLDAKQFIRNNVSPSTTSENTATYIMYDIMENENFEITDVFDKDDLELLIYMYIEEHINYIEF